MAATKTKTAKKPAKADKNGTPAALETSDVLTLAEAAAYLRVSEDAVMDIVHTQGLVGRRIGEEWRFLKSALQIWLSTPVPRPSKEAVLSTFGSMKDDPYMDEMLAEIYKQRGRPMIGEPE